MKFGTMTLTEPAIPNNEPSKWHPILETLENRLVVSCQPIDNGPMDDPSIVAAMASAAVAGGAAGLRIEGIDNLRAVRAVVDVPIVGIVKSTVEGSPVRITVARDHAVALIEAGANIVAYDATDRPRQDSPDVVLRAIRDAGAIAMADCSTVADARNARKGGAGMLGTTLSGYTAETETGDRRPDLQLIREVTKLGSFVMAEGRISTPDDAWSALAAGAHSVTVGTSLTRLELMTGRFVRAVSEYGLVQSISGYAIDIGGTKTAATKIERGRVVRRIHRATDGSVAPAQQVTVMMDVLAELGFAGNEPLGVAVTGRVDHEGRWNAVNLNILGSVKRLPLRAELATRYDKVCVMNDALAATLAEHRLGTGRGQADFAYITVSTGVAGGLILANRLVQSKDGLAGHMGFSTTQLGISNCGSGRFGTVESVAGGKAIAAAARIAGHDVDAKEVFNRSRCGEKWAEDIFDRSAKATAEMIVNLSTIVGIRRCAIGGSVGLSDGYVHRIRHHVARNPSLFQVDVRQAELGGDGPMFGALITAMESDCEKRW